MPDACLHSEVVILQIMAVSPGVVEQSTAASVCGCRKLIRCGVSSSENDWRQHEGAAAQYPKLAGFQQPLDG